MNAKTHNETRVIAGRRPVGAPEGWVTSGHAMIAAAGSGESNYVELRDGSGQLIDWTVSVRWITRNQTPPPALEAVVIEQEATAAKALAVNAIQAYAEDALHNFHGDQALAQADLEKQLEAAGLVAQGKTSAAFEILKGLDTVVRDSIPCDVWRFLLDRLGLI